MLKQAYTVIRVVFPVLQLSEVPTIPEIYVAAVRAGLAVRAVGFVDFIAGFTLQGKSVLDTIGQARRRVQARLLTAGIVFLRIETHATVQPERVEELKHIIESVGLSGISRRKNEAPIHDGDVIFSKYIVADRLAADDMIVSGPGLGWHQSTAIES